VDKLGDLLADSLLLGDKLSEGLLLELTDLDVEADTEALGLTLALILAEGLPLAEGLRDAEGPEKLIVNLAHSVALPSRDVIEVSLAASPALDVITIPITPLL